MVVTLALGGCVSTGVSRTSTEAVADQLMRHYQVWYATPYRFGGNSRSGIDCSGFVQQTYRTVFKRELPRTTEEQADLGRRVSRNNLVVGDLVFFKTGWFKYHVGVYVGRDRFIHASESRGVIESSLNSSYWSKHYWKARRLG